MAELTWQGMYAWTPQQLEEMDTTLALEQYIQQCIRTDPSNIEAIIALPDGYEDTIWQYEHMRCGHSINQQLIIHSHPSTPADILADSSALSCRTCASRCSSAAPTAHAQS